MKSKSRTSNLRLKLREGLNLLWIRTLDSNVGRPTDTLVRHLQDERRLSAVALANSPSPIRSTLDARLRFQVDSHRLDRVTAIEAYNGQIEVSYRILAEISYFDDRNIDKDRGATGGGATGGGDIVHRAAGEERYAMKTTAAAELAWLVDDLVARIPEAQQAILLSADGLLMATSATGLRDGGLAGGISSGHRDDAEHMSAVAASLFGLARGAGRRFGKGKVRQAILEMENGFLFVIAAGNGACLSVLAAETADIGLMAYEMAMLVVRAGRHLGTSVRQPAVVE